MDQVREPRPEKVQQVALLKEKFQNASSIFLTDYSGLSVADITELRRKLSEQGNEYIVIKNTLARLGAKEAGIDGIVEYFEGPIALAISYEDPAVPARVITSFLKSHPKPEIKACLVEGDVLSGGEAVAIAKWPTREELLARLVGHMNYPIQGFVMALGGIIRRLVYVLDAIKDQKESQ